MLRIPSKQVNQQKLLMKKLFTWLVFVIASATSSYAQQKNIAVSGNVVEAETKQGITQATVQLLSLPDSTYVTGIATTAKGRFTLPKASAGKYILKISYIGFQTKIIPLQLTNRNPERNLGQIELESDAIMLSEAVVTAEAPPVTVKADTMEYNASAYRVAEGAMLEELVKKLPGAEISEDGKLTIGGKEVKKIMVDGKEFFSDDPNVAMKNLPSNMVEKVKSYDRKSDMARITGIEDGEEETVLDLTVKKGMKQGWIGNLIAGYGNKDRYEAGGMVSRFKDDASVTIIGSVNNTNNRGFSEFGDAGRGMGGGAGSGITTARSLGVNFAKETQKLQVGGNVQYGFSDNDARVKRSTETFMGESSTFNNSTNNSRRKRHDLRMDFRLEWKPDSVTTIIFRPSASYSNTKTSGDSWSEEMNNIQELINEKKTNSGSRSDNMSINGRLQFFRRLNSEGRNISIGANFGYGDSEVNSDNFSSTEFFKEDSIVEHNRHTDQNNDSRNWSVSASYTEPVFKRHFLQARYEFSHRKQIGQSLVSDPDSIMQNGYVESLSSRVENFYDTHSIQLSIRGVHPKMMYSAGLGLNPQSSLSETTIGPNSNKQLPRQNVLNFAPQVMFRYMFNRQHILMIRYRGRTNTPNISDLQEVIDISDPLNLRYGNPNLKPSFTNNLMLFYNKFVPDAMRSYALNLFFSNTSNSVANRMRYDETTGGRIYEKVNVSGNWNTRGFFSFNTPLKNQKYTISSNTNASFSDAVSYTSVGMEDPILSTTHNFLLGQRLTGNYRSDLFDISLNASINYNLAKNSKQKNGNRETYDYYLGGNTNINLPWDVYISSDINYRIKDGYNDGFNTNELIWNAQISKNFLKSKAATIRLKFYDILKEQSNLTRTIDETRMSDTEYNTLGSYFMVHFVYRLNTLGGKSRSSRSSFDRTRPPHEGGSGRGPGYRM